MTTSIVPEYKSSYKWNEYELVNRTEEAQSSFPPSSASTIKRNSTLRHDWRQYWRGTTYDIKSIQWTTIARLLGIFFDKLWQDVVYVVKHISWTAVGRRFGTFFIPFFVFAGIGVLVAFIQQNATGYTDGPCRPDGSFMLSGPPYDAFSRYFVIDLAFGSFTFAQAKLIDVIWDVVAGRGGQAVLSFISYRTFNKALVLFLESSVVSQDSYSAVTLQNGSIVGLAVLIKDFMTNKGVRARLTMFWIILSGSFILVFPTWIGAMTGYTPAVEQLIADKNGYLVPWQDFDPVVYTIHDGPRIGLQKDHHIIANWTYNDWTHDPFYTSIFYSRYDGIYQCDKNHTGVTPGTADSSVTSNDNCVWVWRVSNYTQTYGFLGSQTISSSDFYHPNGTIINIPGPQPLNISASFYGSQSQVGFALEDIDGCYLGSWCKTLKTRPYGWAWHPENNSSFFPFVTANPLYYHLSSDTTYDLQTVNQRGSCTPSQPVEYQWGFSITTLFYWAIAFTIWLFSTWTIYLDSFLHSRLEASQWHLGMERAILDISDAMRKKFDGDDVRLYDTHKLRSLTRGHYLTYTDLPLDTLRPSRRVQIAIWWKSFHFRPWLRAEKWWLMLLAVFTLLWIIGLGTIGSDFSHGWNSAVAFLPGLGCFFVLILGRQCRGRWLAFLLCWIVFVILDIWINCYWNSAY